MRHCLIDPTPVTRQARSYPSVVIPDGQERDHTKEAELSTPQRLSAGWSLLSNLEGFRWDTPATVIVRRSASQADKGAFDGVYLAVPAAPDMGANLSASATAAFQLNSLLSLK